MLTKSFCVQANRRIQQNLSELREGEKSSIKIEPPHKKTNYLHMQKKGLRSASQ